MRYERQRPYDWTMPTAGHRRPVDAPGQSAEFWRGFAFGVPVALALWLATAFLVAILFGAL